LATHSEKTAPLSDAIIVAVARIVDDAQSGTREPSHSDIEFQIKKVGLQQGDPRNQGQIVGKEKRVRGTLSWAMEYNLAAGEKLVSSLISLIRSCGGFRTGSPNYVGEQAIRNAQDAFHAEGYNLTSDGELRPSVLDNMSGVELTEALEAYVRRSRCGITDAALVTGTGKDLLEATAAHIIRERYGTYSSSAHFPTLLGQAFVIVGLATPQDPYISGEPPQKRLERVMYEVGCAINHLRNKEGTGHGRPWLSSVSNTEAIIAVELMGSVAKLLLDAHKRKP